MTEIYRIFFTFIFGILTLMLNPEIDLKRDAKILPPPEGIQNFHFGFQENFADLFWLNFIQSAFDCSKYKDPNNVRCPHDWGFKTLNTASLLAPRFGALYEFGAVKLTVLLDDHKGAAELFERGLAHIKGNWKLSYRAAYVYLQELKNYNRAGQLLEKSADEGAPFWTRSLASRMYKKSGRLELSYRVLEDLYRQAEEGPWKEDLGKRMAKTAEKLRTSASFQ